MREIDFINSGCENMHSLFTFSNGEKISGVITTFFFNEPNNYYLVRSKDLRDFKQFIDVNDEVNAKKIANPVNLTDIESVERIIYPGDFILAKSFEKIVKLILEQNAFKVEEATNDGYDYKATLGNTFTYIEVKLYKSKTPKLGLLKQAYKRLLSYKDNENAKLILVVSSYVTPSLKDEIFKESGVIVWDAKTLLTLSYDFAATYYNLESILIEAFKEPIDDPTSIDSDFKSKIIPSLKESKTTIKQTQKDNRGEKLCKEINNLNSGKDDAIKFENNCIEILKYLFDNNTDLTLWEKQPTTDDGLHRFDLLCRIISSQQNNFWTELSNDFHTRYVLFEFKNYTDKIKQGQIYSTEKYLFLTALRSVSFIIARNGADGNAIIAARGSLKEAGKLIVILTITDICKMLNLRDKGEEPTIVLREKIDEMLVKLTR